MDVQISVEARLETLARRLMEALEDAARWEAAYRTLAAQKEAGKVAP